MNSSSSRDSAVAVREIYEFGGYRLDPAQRRCTAPDGGSVQLSAKPFDALVYLVEHAGEPVSRKALNEALWPDIVVEDNNLSQAISAVRRAVGKQYVVTLPGRGYQFVGEVRRVRTEEDPAPASPAPREGADVREPAADPAAFPQPRGQFAAWRSRLPSAASSGYWVTAAVAATAGAAAFWLATADPDGRWLHEEVIPTIEAHLESGDWEAAHALARRAEVRAPQAPELAALWPRFTWRATIPSDPPGAAVYRRGYGGGE